jgi:hypothetical protein
VQLAKAPATAAKAEPAVVKPAKPAADAGWAGTVSQ